MGLDKDLLSFFTSHNNVRVSHAVWLACCVARMLRDSHAVWLACCVGGLDLVYGALQGGLEEVGGRLCAHFYI